MRPLRFSIFIALLFQAVSAFCQQDVDFYVTNHLLTGVKTLKIYQNAQSNYVYVLATGNIIYEINTSKNIVTNISAQFSAYGNFQFIDIASPADHVLFVATSSEYVISDNNGTTSLIGPPQGLQGNVTSVGYLPRGGAVSADNPSTLYIGTTSGVGFYNTETSTLGFVPLPYTGQIYITNYRVGLFSYPELLVDPRFVGVAIKSNPGSTDGGYLWDSPVYGNINTALNDFPTLDLSYEVEPYLIYLYWGTANGLYQTPLQVSEYSNNIVQYLNGIQVNKVNDIYGLTSFGNQYFKSNLLVGTSQGLYFSNSTISPDQSRVALSFTHLAALGNVNINDIQTSINNVLPLPTLVDCENNVWLATDDGVYCLKPDYAKYFNVTTVDAISFNNMADTVNETRICPGDSVVASINYDFANGNNIQWFRGDSAIVGQVLPNLTIKSPGNYYAVFYNSCADIHIQTNQLKVDLNAPVFSFNYPDTLKVCGDSLVVLTAEGSSAYRYRWIRNDTVTTDTSQSIAVSQAGKYKVEVSSCPGTWVSSSQVQIERITLPLPTLSSDKPIYCAEDTAMLAVNCATSGAYTINWYFNGGLVAANMNKTTINVTSPGNYSVSIMSNISSCLKVSAPLQVVFLSAPVFTFNYPGRLQYCAGTPVTLKVQGSDAYRYRWCRNDTLLSDTTTSLNVTQTGNYKVQVSSCAGSWISSNSVWVNLVGLGVPTVTSDKPAYCIGDVATLSVNYPPDTSYNINWYKDGTLLQSGYNQSSITANIDGNYTVSVTERTINSDGTRCLATSSPQAVTFNPPPAVAVKEIVETTICAGQAVQLVASYNGGSPLWSTGEMSSSISVTQPGTYKVTITSASGCQADTSITVFFLPDPILNLRDTVICTYKKQVITLIAPPGFTSYNWNNGESTLQVFQVTKPQTVTLMVSDANGCQTSQQINVSEQCPEVFIPNTFTPNGDGINDTWTIEGLDASAVVKVFNRWGKQVYNSAGYSSPWNGEFGGKKLPSGVYYYVITAKNNAERFSGSLTILY